MAAARVWPDSTDAAQRDAFVRGMVSPGATATARAILATAPTAPASPGYNPRAWETYRRDAGCGCTAPDPADCAEDHSPLAGVRPEAQWAFVCVCHRLAAIAPADAPHGPQDAATTVGAGTEATSGGTAPQTAAQPFGLRDRIAQALEQADYREGMRRGDLADAVLAVIEPDRARLVAEMARCRELNRQLVNDALQAGATAPAVNGIADKLDEFIAASAADGAVMGVRDRCREQLVACRETWRRRAEEIEADRDRLARTVDRMRRTNRMVNGAARDARERAEQAEATMQRVLDELDALDDHINAERHTVARIRAALAASATPQ